jgi:hypothetical protein
MSLAVMGEVYYGLKLESYSYTPEYRGISVNGRSATVSMTPCADLVYGGCSGSYPCTEHAFVLIKESGQWRIQSNHYSDAITEQYPACADFVREVMNYRRDHDAYWARWQRWEGDNQGDFGVNRHQESDILNAQPMSGTYINKTVQGQNQLVQYAMNYTDDSHTTSHDAYNELFREDLGNNDCMNFASQCLWAMFGGNNNQQAIEGRYSPMVYNVAGANDWWCTHTASSTTPWWSWTSISNFKSMLFDNSNYDKIGLQGSIGPVWGASVGDLCDHASGGHVYVITGWQDLNTNGRVDWGELKECSHTNNHRDGWLHLTITSTDANFTYINRFKVGN